MIFPLLKQTKIEVTLEIESISNDYLKTLKFDDSDHMVNLNEIIWYPENILSRLQQLWIDPLLVHNSTVKLLDQ